MLTIFTSDRFADHLNPPGHPERIERAEVMQVVAGEFRKRGGRVEQPRPATDADITRVHDPAYVGTIRETSGRATRLDPDTYTSSDTYEIALLAAGAVLSGVDHVLGGSRGTRALAMVRPPGHHAERNRAMGFCLFNNIAVGAAYARAKGLSKVAIVDYDVHHGNGTQWAFYDNPSVLFLSSHQYPFYPGTGAADEIGTGAGAGFTVNFPVDAGGTDADFEKLYDAAASVLERFRPELILLSAGYDAHRDDPLGGMRVTTAQFARLTAKICSVADTCCSGRVVAVTEGGYDLAALAGSLRVTVDVLNGTPALPPAPGGETPRADSSLAAARRHLSKYWAI
jgi:acetoin utilization deacetylase AcuC-like enzyme